MLHSSIQAPEGGSKWGNALAMARTQLAHAATEIALFKPWGGFLTKEEVLDKAGVTLEIAELDKESLWMGWPYAFLTLSSRFDECCKQSSNVEPEFAHVR